MGRDRPLFHFVDWAYRDSGGAVEEHLIAMGMYDLVPNEVGVLERVRTPVVDRFRQHAERFAGSAARTASDGS